MITKKVWNIPLDHIRILEVLCKAKRCYGMYLNFPDLYDKKWPSGEITVEELFKAAPYLKRHEDIQTLVDGSAIMLFKTRKAMQKHYYQTIGDDGPRSGYTNRYKGPARVYAITCNPKGQTENENT